MTQEAKERTALYQLPENGFTVPPQALLAGSIVARGEHVEPDTSRTQSSDKTDEEEELELTTHRL